MKSKKKDFGGGRDIISDLPDELICHILSFLPTKEAAATTVLAKRWKPLLRYVPSLDFDDSLCLNPAKTYEEKRTNARSFMRFVDSVLALQGNARINGFCLNGNDIIDEMWVLDWIQNVVKRHVSDIRLYVSSFWDGFDSSFYPLPREIFVSQTLVTLIINFEGGVNISVEGDVSLPKLKTLHLHYFKIKMSTFNKLVSGCHALEELMLLNLVWDESSEPEPCFVTSLSIPTLKRLEYCRYERDDEAKDKVSLSFESPNVVYLEYFDCVADRYQQVSFDSLVEARLGLRLTYDQVHNQWLEPEYYFSSKEKSNLTKLLTGICNVKILYLYNETLEVLGCCLDTIPVFNNLIELTIETKEDIEWKSLPAILDSCPNLVTLVFEGIHHLYAGRCEDEDGEDDEEDEEFVFFLREQIEHVEHFIEKMPNLEQVILHYHTSNDEDVMKKVFKKLEKLPRVASANCKIQLISDNLSLSSNASD
ncbi:F-box domain [Arabidopsis thaliana x Arabidopsis arenosa]|uniref:F-box domain n=1 Tax=Arabidopsis thaliana x Arabidopsis arenosa TaxID=1240361 RepID=A0A8T1YE09_9BRAS|nr:F-box domain [Arabidopsis thaliana x Arabidopsis arenosa]